MRFVVCAIYLIIIMPITSTGWAEGSNILLDPTHVCKKHRKLPKKLAYICKNDTSLLNQVTRGIAMGFHECESQFKNRRWNCSTQKKSMKRILAKDTRETAFVNAITSAGIAYSVTKACSMGDLVECSCDKNLARRNNMVKYKVDQMDEISSSNDRSTTSNNHNRRSNNNNNRRNNKNNNNNINKNVNKKLKRQQQLQNRQGGKIPSHFTVPDSQWQWGGCDDNVNFGVKKSKEFLDARRKRSDIKTLVRLHNNDAGRLAVKKSTRLECKCHGLSGSCTMKTCWSKLASFNEVAIRLKERFDGAAKVIASNDGNHFIPEGKTIKPPSRQDLIYTDESPDFCRPNVKTGSLGTYGRECNNTSEDVDGCDLLCCNRGYKRTIKQIKYNCKCKFFWCCEVKCTTCYDDREIYTCE